MGKDESPSGWLYLVALVIDVPCALWSCYVDWCYWYWFAVPLGAPVIGYWHFLGLAMLVGLATLVLGFHVIPSFTGRIESILKDDAEAIMFRAIEKGGSLGDMMREYRVHADGVYPEKNLLTGVVVTKLDEGRVERIMAARQVVAKIEVGKHNNQLVLEMYDGTVIDNETRSEGAFAKDV